MKVIHTNYTTNPCLTFEMCDNKDMSNKAKEQIAINSIETTEQIAILRRCIDVLERKEDLTRLPIMLGVIYEIAELNGIQLDPFVSSFNDYNDEHNDYSPYE